MKQTVRKCYSDTEGGRTSQHLTQLKHRKKGKKLQRSLSENARQERERERSRRRDERRRARRSEDSPYTPYTPYLSLPPLSHGDSPDPESFYSQTESQLEDFVGSEFRKDYDLQLYQRLEKMSKETLMSEYFSQERKIEKLERRISDSQSREREMESKNINGDSTSIEMITVFPLIQRLADEFNILKTENEKLLLENSALSHKLYSITT